MSVSSVRNPPSGGMWAEIHTADSTLLSCPDTAFSSLLASFPSSSSSSVSPLRPARSPHTPVLPPLLPASFRLFVFHPPPLPRTHSFFSFCQLPHLISFHFCFCAVFVFSTGNPGTAIAFVSEKNRPILRDLLDLLTETKQATPKWFFELVKESCGYGGHSGHGYV